MDEKFPEFTVYFKIGIIGMAEEVTETLDIKIDPNLSEEENLKALALKGQIAQLRMQVSMAELMMDKLPRFIEQRDRDEEPDSD